MVYFRLMEKLQKNVREFQKAVGQELRSTPGFPSEADVELSLNLIVEEVKELKDAVNEGNLVEVADALADILVTTLGCGNFYGIDLEAVFDEVHKSNMTKVIDGWADAETGKWQKGPSYVKADVKTVLGVQPWLL